jgi:hypothetical protein
MVQAVRDRLGLQQAAARPDGLGMAFFGAGQAGIERGDMHDAVRFFER